MSQKLKQFIRTGNCAKRFGNANACSRVWHERMGHVGKESVKRIQRAVTGMHISSDEEIPKFCKGCALGQGKREKYQRTKAEAKRGSNVPGEGLHADVCGPISNS